MNGGTNNSNEKKQKNNTPTSALQSTEFHSSVLHASKRVVRRSERDTKMKFVTMTPGVSTYSLAQCVPTALFFSRVCVSFPLFIFPLLIFLLRRHLLLFYYLPNYTSTSLLFCLLFIFHRHICTTLGDAMRYSSTSPSHLLIYSFN